MSVRRSFFREAAPPLRRRPALLGQPRRQVRRARGAPQIAAN